MNDPLRPEYDPVSSIDREMKLVKAQNADLRRQVHVLEDERDQLRGRIAMLVFESEALIENLNRAVMLQKSAEEMSSARALEVERLKEQLAGFLGPKCEAKECPDYDGAHPYHANAIEKAHDAGQALLREENALLRAQMERLNAAVTDAVG